MISCAASNGEGREDCILWHMAYLGRYCTYLVCVVHKMKKHVLGSALSRLFLHLVI